MEKYVVTINGIETPVELREGLSIEESAQVELLKQGFKKMNVSGDDNITKDQDNEGYADIVITDAMKVCLDKEKKESAFDVIMKKGETALKDQILEIAKQANAKVEEISGIVKLYLKSVAYAEYATSDEKSVKRKILGFISKNVGNKTIDKETFELMQKFFTKNAEDQKSVHLTSPISGFDENLKNPIKKAEPKFFDFPKAGDAAKAEEQIPEPVVPVEEVKPEETIESALGIKRKSPEELRGIMSKSGSKVFGKADDEANKEIFISRFVDMSDCPMNNNPRALKNVIDRLFRALSNPKITEAIEEYGADGRLMFKKEWFHSHNKMTLVSPNGKAFLNIMSWNSITVGDSSEF